MSPVDGRDRREAAADQIFPVANEILAEMEEKPHHAPIFFPNLMMSKLQTYQKALPNLHQKVRRISLTTPPGG